MKKKRYRPSSKRAKRRKIYLLPNLFTTGSLFFGFFAIIKAMEAKYHMAASSILISFLLDGVDGWVARRTNSVSSFGMQYDSLSDLIAFGIAPALLIYMWALKPYGRLGWIAAFLFVVCGALRLARFNVQATTIQKEGFKGLPIPGAAGLIATLILFYHSLGIGKGVTSIWLILLLNLLSFLMVSNIPYFSLKNSKLLKDHSFNILMMSILIFILVAYQPALMLFLIMSAYVVSGPIESFTRLLIGKKKEKRKEVARDNNPIN